MVLRRPTEPAASERLPVIVLDLVTPRGFGLAELPAETVDVRDQFASGNKKSVPEVSRLGMLDTVLLAADGRPVPDAAAVAELIRAVFSLIVAESTVFCLLKLLLVTAE
jgi:hypothetical protein